MPSLRSQACAIMIVSALQLTLLVSTVAAQWTARIVVNLEEFQLESGGIYGTFGPVSEVTGQLVRAEPYDACMPLKPVKIDEPWIGLAKRGGNCTFYEKIQHMKKRGAIGAIIGNNVPFEVVAMQDARLVSISSIFVSSDTAESLEAAAQINATVVMSMNGRLNYLSYHLPDVLSDSTRCLIILCILATVTTLTYYFRRKLAIKKMMLRIWAKRQALHQAVQELPVASYSPPSTPMAATCDMEGLEACAICLEPFRSGDQQRELLCRHGRYFHLQCIDPWLTMHQTCPLCKSSFLPLNSISREISISEIDALDLDDHEEDMLQSAGMTLCTTTQSHASRAFLRLPTSER